MWEGEYPQYGMVFDVVMRQAHRWEYLDLINVGNPIVLSLMKTLQLRGAPNLKTLIMIVHLIPITKPFSINKSTLPMLESLTLVGKITLDIQPSLAGETNMLRSLHLGGQATMKRCLMSVRQCLHLQALKLRVEPPIPPPSHFPRITLPHLTNLSIMVHSSLADPGPLLNSLHTPALRSLQIHCETNTLAVEWTWPHLSRFLERSRPPLQNLDLATFKFPIQPPEITRCFGYLMNLRVLALSEVFLQGGCITQITQEARSSTGFLPELQELHLKPPDGAAFSSLCAMLTALWEQTLLQKVFLYMESFPENQEGDRSGIWRCLGAGLQLYITEQDQVSQAFAWKQVPPR